MSTLSLYIIRQILAPLLIITITLSSLIWTLRVLQTLDDILISGANLNAWSELLFYTLLPLLMLTIPPAFFVATLYAFYRLFLDNEITVLFSVGISRLKLAQPVLLVAFATALLVLMLGFYATPWAHRTIKMHMLEIETDMASAMFQPGKFTNPTRGITAFIRERDENNFIYGIFFQDSRDRDHPVSYTAESGNLVKSGDSHQLIMFNGHVQHYDRDTSNSGITLIQFDRYSYDLSLLAKAKATTTRRRELYPADLLARIEDPQTTKREREKTIASIHGRLLKPIYVILYALLALAVFLPAQINREGYMRRILAAIAAALAIRIGGIYVTDFFAAASLEGAILAYALPISMGGAAIFIIARGVGPISRMRHYIATARS